MITAFRVILLIVIFISFLFSIAGKEIHQENAQRQKENAQRAVALSIAGMISFVASFYIS